MSAIYTSSTQLFLIQPRTIPASLLSKMRRILRFNRYFYTLEKGAEGKRTKPSDTSSIVQTGKLKTRFMPTQRPLFLEQRIQQFVQIKQRMDRIMEATTKPNINIRLRDNKQIAGQAFLTTPLSIAKSISKNLAEQAIAARIKYSKRYESPLGKKPVSAEAEQHQSTQNDHYELIDLTQPLEGDCELQIITFQDKLGKQIFWHSSSHLLGQALQNSFGAWLCHGPALQHGFFYDSYLGDHRISQSDYEKIEKEIRRYVQQKQPYEKILLSKTEALEMFSYNPFKVELIKSKVPDDGLTSAYRCGNLIDLCTGPHLPSADKIKGFKVTKNSSAYWLGKKENDDLQRVYAISYPKQSQLDEYLKQQQQLAKRDHRTIGPKQQLFNFTSLSPGSALFFPHGTTIYNRLVELMRSEYRIRGYSEVISPNIYNSELWKQSGHYFKYKENIFFINQNGEENGLKPMNCPGHCIMFDLMQHSYRDLPIRMADFGVLHRNQLHGALSGLTRVRRFQQDDAHIFCRVDQIETEILAVLDLLDYIYSVFGFKYVLELSTRPEKYLGELTDWNVAEDQLKQALLKFGKEYKLNEGDGAFYGPKIDVKLFDVFGREHQCGTVQLDFQLPVRFNLQYRTKQVKQIHEPIQEHDQPDAEQKSPKKHQKAQISAEEITARKKQKSQKKKKHENQTLGNSQTNTHDHHGQSCSHHHEHGVEKREESLADMQARYEKVGHLKNGFTRPVIIHRAIFGSLERFIAILCEHTGGKWDFWISPRQLKIISIGHETAEFAEQVYNTFLLKGFSVEIDRTNENLNKKIRNAQIEGFNYIGVIGKNEATDNSINLRKRDESKELGIFKIDEVVTMFESYRPPKSKRREELEKQSIVR